MTFLNVLSGKPELPPIIQPKAKATKKKSEQGLGCSHCPLDKAKGVRKIKGLVRIKSRKIFIWAESPGSEENEQGKELVGPAGRLLWEELENIGITRDMCDIQNVVRCRPTQQNEYDRVVNRTPTKEEAKCCSVHTEEALALNNGKAVVHMVFGQFAATTLLGREYKKDTPIFWSQRLQAKVVVLDHPSYFLRGAPQHRLKIWRARMRAAAKVVDTPGQFAFLDKQQYKSVTTVEHAKQVLRLVKKSAKKHRVTVDIEDGVIDPDTGAAAEEGVRVILAVGICWKPGQAYTFFIDHPEIFKKNRKHRDELIDLLDKEFLSDASIKKALQHGTHDVKRFKELWDVTVRGYNFDTNYSSYLKWPDQRKHGLEEQAKLHVPLFAGYKDIVKPYLDPVKVNYATIPMAIMRRYNGADADLCKRMEIITKSVDGPLLRTYTKAAFVVDDMQTRGPYLDYKYYNQVQSIIPVRRAKIAARLKQIADSPDINLNAPQQCAVVIYDKLKLPSIDEKSPRGTADGILSILGQRKKGEFPKLLAEHRKLVKMEGTYLDNYKLSADMYEGMLRTIWWLTGTITGRLRSGGKDEPGIVNLQNLHGDDLLLNLLVSDVRWRIADKLGKDLIGELWSKIKKLRIFTAWDYAQIEIRILAHMSEDPKLINAVLSGDIHSTVGHELTGIPVLQIKNDKNTRVMIKGLHFGIVYGLTPKNLFTKLTAEGVKTTLERTEELHATYFRKFKRVRDLIEHLKDFAERKGYVETIFGFRRPIYTGENDSGRTTFWGNQAVNSPIQGSAHQLMLCGMALLATKKKTYSLLQTPVMEVHDAFAFYNQTEDLPESYKQGKHLLETAIPQYVEDHFKFKLKVPIEAECKAGYRLGVLPEYKGGSVKEHIKLWQTKNIEVTKKVEEQWGKLAA